MGNVNFNTNVTKTVDLNKDVFLDVNKDVFAFANVEGNLATAEASADAVPGGGGDDTAEQIKVPFIPDANAVLGLNGIAPQQVTANPNSTNPAVDSLVLPGSDTDFTNQVTRYIAAEVIDLDGGVPEGQSTTAVNDITAQQFDFAQAPSTGGNGYVRYEIAGGEDPFPLDSNAGIIADNNEKVAAFLAANPGVNPATPEGFREVQDFIFGPDGVCYTFLAEDIFFDPGEAANTARVSLIVSDTSENYAIVTAALIPDDVTGEGFNSSDGLDIRGTFAALIDPVLSQDVPAGTVIAAVDGTEVGLQNSLADSARIVQVGIRTDVDGNGNPVDLDNLAGWQVLFEDDPTQTLEDNAGIPVDIGGGVDPNEPGLSSGDFFDVGAVTDALGVVIPENPSEEGTDVSAPLVWTTCIEQVTPGGSLAETDTFAQVSPEGAFSFSESLAATDSFDLG